MLVALPLERICDNGAKVTVLSLLESNYFSVNNG